MFNEFYENRLVPFISQVRTACRVGAIPLSFDNSLSYYEQIAAFSAKLNEIICTVNNQNIYICDFMTELQDAFAALSGDFAEKWSEIQSEFAVIGGKINGMKLDISDLDERVTALEEQPAGGGVGQTVEPGTFYRIGGTETPTPPEYGDYETETNCEIFNEYDGENGAAGNYSSAFGFHTRAMSDYSHTEGLNTIAAGTDGAAAHAEGNETIATGAAAHAEGSNSRAYGAASHAEGTGTRATGANSHAGGYNSLASGAAATAIGTGTTAAGNNMVAIGSYNNSTTGSYLVIGDGTDESTKHDLFKITTDGKFAFGSNIPFDPQTDHEKISNAGSFVPVSLTPTITAGDNVDLDSYSMIQCGKVVTFYASFTTNNNIYGGVNKLLLTLSDFPKAAHNVIFTVITYKTPRPVMFAEMVANTTTWEARYSNLSVDIDSGYKINIYGTYITSD